MLMAAARRLVLVFVGLVVLVLPAGAGAAEGCLNEALRQEQGSGFLPDCRAYEMVTPVYKAGHEFSLSSFSSDGNRVFLESFGVVAGAVGESEDRSGPAVYLGSRTDSGWQLTPVNAPVTEFDQSEPAAVEADSGLSLWNQHTPTQSLGIQDLYVRSSDGSEYSLVGPQNSPNTPLEREETSSGLVAGATSDYGHVLLQASRLVHFWPFDETSALGENPESLYEYSGTGNGAPILVGVSGGKGETQLLGKCGTALGGASESGKRESAYNALSSDGETVFFTLFPRSGGCEAGPVVDEVWARRHGGLHSPGTAESVDVSARAREPWCSGACRVSPESGKEFEGASEDGARVFFTSTQQLLNGASQDPEVSDSATAGSSGDCAESTGVGGCDLYEYDFGAPGGDDLSLVAGGAEVLGVARVAEDGSRVYFVAKGRLTAAGNEFGASAVAGQPNLYVYDTEEAEHDPGYRPVFIATLSFNDSQDWQRDDRRPVQATPDGRFLLFPSSRPGLTPGDTAAGSQLFEYDAQTGELVRVSQGEDGYAENGNGPGSGVATTGVFELQFRARDFHTSVNTGSISRDGMTVVFEGAGFSGLASSAERAGCSSVYEYRSAGAISDGGVHLISDGVDVQTHVETCGAQFVGMDASGANIFFSTADSLLASDTDGGQRDIYDARVGGGFTLPASAVGCEGDGCLGAPGVPPLLAGPGSMGVAGGGNLPAVVAAPKVRVKVKPLTRAQKLSKALRLCRRRSRKERGACEAVAHRRYGSSAKTGRAAVRVGKANGRGQ
jgi:hypothetical protein